MVFSMHVELYGLPVRVPGKEVFRGAVAAVVGERCAPCGGSGMLPGSTITRPKICHDCNGYGRLMTAVEENEFLLSLLDADDEDEANLV